MTHRKKVKKGPVWHGSLFNDRPISPARIAEFDKLGRLREQSEERATAEAITRPPTQLMRSIAHGRQELESNHGDWDQ
jgi:hypothetical protein